MLWLGTKNAETFQGWNMELAEGVGFEPTRGYSPLPVFKTGALNRSATLPCLYFR